jgi:hypothetical protein
MFAENGLGVGGRLSISGRYTMVAARLRNCALFAVLAVLAAVANGEITTVTYQTSQEV